MNRKRCKFHHRLRVYLPMILLSHRLRHIYTHFWQVHYFELQHELLQTNGFCCFISDQDKNISSFVATFLYKFLQTKAILQKVFSNHTHMIVYLPEKCVVMTYSRHTRKTTNTPSCTTVYF